LGALIIKERLKATDEDAVELIKESPYLQYFLGLTEFNSNKAVFDSSMYVHFRKRFSVEVLNSINERIVKASIEKSIINSKDGEQENSSNLSEEDQIKKPSENKQPENNPSVYRACPENAKNQKQP
jgi:hypothetical protein